MVRTVHCGFLPLIWLPICVPGNHIPSIEEYWLLLNSLKEGKYDEAVDAASRLVRFLCISSFFVVVYSHRCTCVDVWTSFNIRLWIKNVWCRWHVGRLSCACWRNYRNATLNQTWDSIKDMLNSHEEDARSYPFCIMITCSRYHFNNVRQVIRSCASFYNIQCAIVFVPRS